MPLAAALSRDAAFVTAGSCTEAKPANATAARSTTPRVHKAMNRRYAIALLPAFLVRAGGSRLWARPSRWRLTSVCRRYMDTNRTGRYRLTLIWRHGVPERSALTVVHLLFFHLMHHARPDAG
jgi:hypothetical protein